MNKNNAITLTAINKEAGAPMIYRNQTCELTVTLKNETGGEIILQQGVSSLQVALPGVTAEETKRMQISCLGWSLSRDGKPLKMTYTGPDDVQWADQEELTLIISQILTNAQPCTGNLQVNPSNFIPKLPLQLFTTVVISNPPVPGNAKLEKVLQLSLDHGGLIYVSSPSDKGELEKLENTLLLNIKNIGDTPLFSGSKKIKPRIEAFFVYGSSIGCLTPASEEMGGSYAWDILASVPYQSEENLWEATQPSKTSGDSYPSWVLKPQSTNVGLIGVSENANITFSFLKIVAVSPPGHTQILLHFTGFWKDDKTSYDDALFVLDIVKQASPMHGALQFFATVSMIEIHNPTAPFDIELRWLTFYAAKVNVTIEAPYLDSISETFYPESVLDNGRGILHIKGITAEMHNLKATLTAYSHTGNLINALQYSITLQHYYFIDSKDGRFYQGVKIGKLLWMSENLACIRSGKPCRNKDNGRLYDWNSAQYSSTTGWRLPSCDDWKALMEACPGNDPYDLLVGDSGLGFHASLGGYTLPQSPVNRFEGIIGRYWLCEEDGQGNSGTVSFDSIHKTVLYGDDMKLDKGACLSVRFVKELK